MLLGKKIKSISYNKDYKHSFSDKPHYGKQETKNFE